MCAGDDGFVNLKSGNLQHIGRLLIWRTGGHSIFKLNTMCETSLLPLYYMA